MTQRGSIQLSHLMPPRRGSVDPSRFPSEEFDLYSIPSFDRGEPEVVKGAQIGSSKQTVLPGDVLLSRIVPHIRRAWVVGQSAGRRLIGSGEWIVFRGEGVDPRYLRWVFVSDPFHRELMRTVSGVGGSLLRARPAHVAKIRIPLPPLHEQRRIAEILDKADALRAKRREALAKLDTLTQSIFLEMFGDPATNPKGWPMVRLENEITSVRYGTGSPPPYVERGVAFIRATNVKAGTVVPRDLRYISEEEADRIEKCRVRAGNLIIVRSGVNTGDCAIVPQQYDRACAAFDLIVDLAWENAVFYSHLINSSYGKAYLEPLTRRAAQPHLNAEQLKALLFISPDRHSKERFARIVEGVNELRTQFAIQLSTLDRLFNSLQVHVFRS